MSEEIVVSGNSSTAMQLGGVGMGASIFKPRASMVELVHKSSRQENVRYGEFRVVSTNEHLGTTIRVVLLAVPQEQREWFMDPTVFTKENKGCFSLDGIQPHPRAAQPPAMFCKTCPKGDSNWVTWRKTHDPKDLPPCGAYYHLLLADRSTQSPYFLNIKGKSFLPFKQAMEQQMSGLLAKLFANVKAENKARGYTLVSLRQGNGPVYQEFRPTEGVAPELPALPSPNIFDVSFDIFSHSKDGGPFQMGFRNFALMKPEDRAEFGQLYLEIVANKAQVDQAYTEEKAAEDAAFNAVSETPAQQAKGEILPPQEPITI